MEACARVCVCLSVLSVRAWGEKSIDLRLHLDRLPLPSNGLTLWPLKVRRQLSRIACRHATCQPCMLARKFLSFSGFFFEILPVIFCAPLLHRNVYSLLRPCKTPTSYCHLFFFFSMKASDGGHASKVSLVARSWHGQAGLVRGNEQQPARG